MKWGGLQNLTMADETNFFLRVRYKALYHSAHKSIFCAIYGTPLNDEGKNLLKPVLTFSDSAISAFGWVT